MYMAIIIFLNAKMFYYMQKTVYMYIPIIHIRNLYTYV